MNGVCVTHPVSPDVVGQNRLDVADGKVEHKIAYWAVHDGLIFKAGTYE